jgi:hypothetical protein
MTSFRVLIGVILGGESKNDNKKKIWGPLGPLIGLEKAKKPQN